MLSSSGYALDLGSLWDSTFTKDFAFTFTDKKISNGGVDSYQPIAIASVEGGFICVLDARPLAPVVLKIQTNGNIEWIHTLKKQDHLATQAVAGLSVADDGKSFLVVGSSNALDLVGGDWDAYNKHGEQTSPPLNDPTPTMGWAICFKLDGTIAWEKIYGEQKKNRLHRLKGCTTIPNGYVLIGTHHSSTSIPFSKDEALRGWFPWVLKIDKMGNVLSESIIQYDGGALIKARDTTGHSFMSPINISGDFCLVFVAIDTPKDWRRKSGEIIPDMSADGFNPRLLIIKFSSSGKEVSRTSFPIHNDISEAALALRSQGTNNIFLDMNSSYTNRGFDVLRVDDALQVINHQWIQDDEFTPSSIFESPSGRKYVVGHSLKAGRSYGRATLGVLEDSGKVTHKIFLESPSFGPVSVYTGSSIVVLYRDGDFDGVRLASFTVK